MAVKQLLPVRNTATIVLYESALLTFMPDTALFLPDWINAEGNPAALTPELYDPAALDERIEHEIIDIIMLHPRIDHLD